MGTLKFDGFSYLAFTVIKGGLGFEYRMNEYRTQIRKREHDFEHRSK